MGKVNNEYIFESGKFKGEIIIFDKKKNDIRCTIWKSCGTSNLCYDFNFSEIKDLRELILNMDLANSKKMGIYEPDEEDEHFKKIEEKQKTWWYKFKWYIRDIGLHVEPFNWKFRIGAKSSFYTMKDCILSLGPIKITWGKIKNAKQ